MFRVVIAVAIIVGMTGGARAADAAMGQQVYDEKCRGCHALGEGGEKRGPDLVGVMDRKAAAVEGFKYSDAMVEAAQKGLVWDVATLGQFLTKPRKVVNGSFMNFTGLSKPEDVANVIAYLATFSKLPAQ